MECNMFRYQFQFNLLTIFSLLPTFVATAHIAAHHKQCSSNVCRQSARLMAESLDRQVSPCDDFYRFSCGGWLQRYDQIPSTKPSYSVTIQVQDKMIETIRSSLESMDTAKHSSHTIRLAKFLYDQCLSIDNESDQTHLLRSLFINRKQNENNDDDPWYKIYQSKKAAIHAMFRIVVIANPRNTAEMILAMDTVPFPLGDIMDVRMYGSSLSSTSNTPTMNAYRYFLGNISRLIPYLRHQSHSDIVKLVDEMIDIEIGLASIKMTELQHQDLSKIINVMNIDEFEMKVNFSWLNHVLRPTFRIFNVSDVNISSKNLLLITDLDYFRQFNQFMQHIPGNRLNTFLDFQIVRMITPFLGEQYRQHLFEFLKSKSGVRQTPERWRTCYNQIEKLLPWALSRLYIDHNDHIDDNDINEASKLIDSIHETFIEMIMNNDDNYYYHHHQSLSPIDDYVRQMTVEKLRQINKNVAFPRWLLDDKQLDSMHNVEFDEQQYKSIDNYVPSMIRFEWNQMKSNLQQLNNHQQQIKDMETWAMEPATINAAYSPLENTITIPAAILTAPYFNSKLPLSMNYGAIGSVIGHELTHSLDDDGLHFDHKGNYHLQSVNDSTWLMKTFEKRYECLQQQYSNIREPVTGLQLNGNNTLSENIADNGGLRQAYHAFRVHQTLSPEQANGILADLPEFNPDQLFFIANAQIWCTRYRPQSLWSTIHHDPHVPAQYRVNVPASNMAAFARAFDCPVGSAMNPSNKCILW